jgi:hypothetical protein
MHVNYYNFEISCEPKVIGVRNGVYQGTINEKKYKNKENWNLYDDNIYYRKPEYKSIPDYYPLKGRFELKKEDFFIENFTFEKSAKLTDFILHTSTFLSCPFIVNIKAKEFLESLHLPLHKFYRVENVFYKEHKLDDLYLFCLPDLSADVIIWSETQYHRGLLMFKNIDYILEDEKKLVFNGYEEYLNRNIPTTVDLYKMVLKRKYVEQFDIFDLVGGGGILVSERFKELYEKEGLTGADIYISKLPTFEFK